MKLARGMQLERQGCALGSLIPRLHFSCHQKNGSGQLPTPFSFKCTGMLVYCNLMLDIIEDCIPHCVPNEMNVNQATLAAACRTRLFYLSKGAQLDCLSRSLLFTRALLNSQCNIMAVWNQNSISVFLLVESSLGMRL